MIRAAMVIIAVVIALAYGFPAASAQKAPALQQQRGELWTASFYCSCVRCCGKNDGVTASGKKAAPGVVACNWLPFGTVLEIDGVRYTVADRGARRHFGSMRDHKKRVDIWTASHAEALRHGKKSVRVVVMRKAAL